MEISKMPKINWTPKNLQASSSTISSAIKHSSCHILYLIIFSTDFQVFFLFCRFFFSRDFVRNQKKKFVFIDCIRLCIVINVRFTIKSREYFNYKCFNVNSDVILISKRKQFYCYDYFVQGGFIGCLRLCLRNSKKKKN